LARCQLIGWKLYLNSRLSADEVWTVIHFAKTFRK
jgi:hypothetical protein